MVNEAWLCAMEKPGGRSLSGGLMRLLGLALLPESCLLLGLLWDPCTRLLGTPTCRPLPGVYVLLFLGMAPLVALANDDGLGHSRAP